MDEKLLKHMAVNSIALMLIVFLISVVISHYDQTLTYAKSSRLNSDSSGWIQEAGNKNFLNSGGKTGDAVYNTSVGQQLGNKYLIITKPDKSYYNIHLEDLYMEKSIRLTITDLKEEILDTTSIVRVNQGIEFTENGAKAYREELNKASEDEKFLVPQVISATGGITDYGTVPKPGISDPAEDIGITYKQEGAEKLYTVIIDIVLDSNYAPVLYQDEDNVYIALRRPKDIYDKIVVIDAGHGGKDCGSFSQGEQYYEKDMNLDIVLKLKEMLDQEDLKVYYTRTEDITLFLNPRVNFANEVEADLFISIHCNSNESAEPSGSEVLYNENEPNGGLQSKRLAKIALEEITNVTNRVNRGLVPGSEMVIVGKSRIPVALIEVAFMSNRQDLDFLLKDENKENIAEAVYKVILRAFDEIN